MSGCPSWSVVAPSEPGEGRRAGGGEEHEHGCTSACPSRLARAFQRPRLRVSAEGCAFGSIVACEGGRISSPLLVVITLQINHVIFLVSSKNPESTIKRKQNFQ